MKNKLLLILISSCLSFTFAQTGDVQNESLDDLYKEEIVCNQENNYTIEGKNHIKHNETAVYTINTLSGSEELKINNVEYQLYKNNEIVEVYTGEKYLHNFVNLGEFKIIANLQEENGCKYSIEKTTNVYKDFVYYLGDNISEFDLGLTDNLGKSGIYFKKQLLSNNNLFLENEFLNKIQQDIEVLKSSNYIIINNKNFSSIFQSLSTLAENNDYNFNDKKIFVISELNENFIKRLLARYYKNINNAEVYIIDNVYLLNFLSSFSTGKDINSLSYLNKFSISYQESPKYLPLSYLIDLLIYNGFPSVLISFILTLCIGSLIITIFRQIIGFSIFGIYSPLLFAVSISVIGIKFSALLLFIAFLSTTITRLFTSRIYLLSSAKVSVNVMLYFVFTLIVLSLNSIFNLNIIDLSIFNDSYIIFPILFLLIIAEKVFHEGFNIFSKGWWFSFIEFLFVSSIVFYIISRISLKYVLISYPELIFLIIALNIYVGRFTGLQVLEYLRFMPLIKRHFEEEE